MGEGEGEGDEAGGDSGVDVGIAGGLASDGSGDDGPEEAAGTAAVDASPHPAKARLIVSRRTGSAARPVPKGWFTGPIVPPSAGPALARVDP